MGPVRGKGETAVASRIMMRGGGRILCMWCRFSYRTCFRPDLRVKRMKARKDGNDS